MFIQPYNLDELHFAYCYRIYLRWRTHRAEQRPQLSRLERSVLDRIANRYGMHVLEATSSATDVMLLVSLKPEETVSACVSKFKGQVSKWLRETLNLATPTQLLSHGYFACTTGKSTGDAVDEYLNHQAEHHCYADRALPPVCVQRYMLSPAELERVQAKHACTVLHHHLVFATWHRRGVFGETTATAIAECWRRVIGPRARIAKVSFVPDHVHLAVRVHPAVSPAELIVRLLNAAQDFMVRRFGDTLIHAGVERLWQPSAYLGSYGDLAAPQIAKYIRQWEMDTKRG